MATVLGSTLVTITELNFLSTFFLFLVELALLILSIYFEMALEPALAGRSNPLPLPLLAVSSAEMCAEMRISGTCNLLRLPLLL